VSSPGVPFVVGDEGEEYVHMDAIGSVRMVTGHGGYVRSRHDYLPFGDEWPPGGTPATIGFAGTERDGETETGSWAALNYLGARHLHAPSGRFTSPDPVTISARRVLDPQQLNLFAYARNNPLVFVDPDGREVQVLDALALERIRSTLPPELRDFVRLDARGFIDRALLEKGKSDDLNFVDLLELVRSPRIVQVATARSAGIKVDGELVEFEFESAAAINAEMKRRGIAVQVTRDSKYLGHVLTSEGLRVMLSDGSGRASTAPIVEHAVTTAHELYGHALLHMRGQPWEHDQRDGKPGPVDRHIIGVEDRTRRLYVPK
jgi:RHS repeat-associated protein